MSKLFPEPLRHWSGGGDLAVKLADPGLKPTPGALLDFSAVLTTKQRDRDGDTLDPAGGELDPAMPLLWAHDPARPIGKMVRLLHRDHDSIRCQYCLADTPLGRDAAALLKLGALRMSHGFKPLKSSPQMDGQGWKIDKWQCLESSLVAIPSNPGTSVLSIVEGVKCYSPEARELVTSLGAASEWDRLWREHCSGKSIAQQTADDIRRLGVERQARELAEWQRDQAERQQLADALGEHAANMRILALNFGDR